MSRIERFEEIQAWQRARALNGQIYTVTSKDKFRRDYSLKEQLKRASMSIMLNIAEGFARRTNKEFSQFLFIAHGSTAEVQSALYIARDQNYISDDEFQSLYQEAEDISKMITGFIKYLRKSS